MKLRLKQLPQLSLYNQELDKFKLYLLVAVEVVEKHMVVVVVLAAIDVLQIFNYQLIVFHLL
jgi:hypothetical protein|tara:strand:+ start:70 stop:255 length:186 start_codon:yes stop_codon:yes gene_type:complete